MASLLLAEGVSCRSCGATRAPSAEEAIHGVCANCWARFSYWRRGNGSQDVEEDFAMWLARKVFLDVGHLNRTGLIGRCEAASAWLYGRRGTQCGHRATEIRDGHRVCALHLKCTNPAYVNEKSDDPYEQLASMMVEVAERDPEFRKMLADVHARAGCMPRTLAPIAL